MTAKSSDQVATVQELVAHFISIGLAQYDALYVVDTKKYNRLFGRMRDVENELKRREGDQRHALLPLLDHPNVQVRMTAAHGLLAISPVLARKAFESVRESEIFPQAMYAGMSLRALDNGTYVPS
jgi:hypothetical protein